MSEAAGDSVAAAAPARPCLHCGYALDGLGRKGRCPECNTAFVQATDVGLEGSNCIWCDYSLAGLPRTGNCPECGQAAEPSISLERWLWHPRLGRRALGGLRVIFWTMMSAVGLLFLGWFVAIAESLLGDLLPLALVALVLAGTVWYVTAWWRIGAATRQVGGRRRRGAARQLPPAGSLAAWAGGTMAVLAVGLVLCSVFRLEGLAIGLAALFALACFTHLAAGAWAVVDVAEHLKAAKPRRYAARAAAGTAAWHGLVLLDVMIILVGLAVGAGEETMTFFVGAWFFSWLGHLAWLVWMLVVVGRVAGELASDLRGAATPEGR